MKARASLFGVFFALALSIAWGLNRQDHAAVDRTSGVLDIARPEPRGELLIPAPKYTEIHGQRLIIEDQVIGVSTDGWWTYVVLTGTFADGTRFESATSLDHIRTVVSYPSDLHGARIQGDAGLEYTVEDISLALDREGYLMITDLTASSSDGKGFQVHSTVDAFGAGCCALYEVPWGCITSGECNPAVCTLPCVCNGDGYCLIFSKFICRGGCASQVSPNCPRDMVKTCG